MFGDLEDVLVAAPRHQQDDVAALADFARHFARPRQGVGRLQRRNDAFQLRAQLESFQRLIICR